MQEENMKKIKKYFNVYEGTPRGKNSSVHCSEKRLNIALGQISGEPAAIDKIIKYVKEFFGAIGIKKNVLQIEKVSEINFDIPKNEADYDEKCSKNKWKYNTAGILVHQLNKSWNDTFVLIFPLANIPDKYKRGDIERAVGNYLIDKKVPIIDFYSHNY
jgi:hypothetical protein